MKKILTSVITINLILLSSMAIASNNVPLNYNVLPEIANGYVVDSAHTSQLEFSLFENEDALYYNNQALEVIDNKFSISTSGLSGKNEFTITNSIGEVSTYTYYISNSEGYLEGFYFEGLEGVETYIKTVRGISILYTKDDAKVIKDLETIILSLPEKVIVNLDEIRLVPANHTSGAAGITDYDKITLYNLSKYSEATIKNIVIHEIAHTWAFDLMKDKIIDYSYTNYREIVSSDKKFPSTYAKKNVAQGNYNEDFAESVSFYLINEDSFNKKFPARSEYIKALLEN